MEQEENLFSSWKGANGSQGRHGLERKKMLGHKLQISCFNKKQKTEQVFEVVSQKHRLGGVRFFQKNDTNLRLLPSVPIKNQRKSSHDRRIAASDLNATEEQNGKLWSNVSIIFRR